MMIFLPDDLKLSKIPKFKVNSLEREFIGIAINDNKEWICGNHSLLSSRLLTINDPRYLFTDNNIFKGILYPPQSTLLHVMIQLEQIGKFTVTDGENYNLCNKWPLMLHTNMARLSEKFSFGKTVLALALVCAQKNVENLNNLSQNITYNNGFLPNITIQYSKTIPITVVAAASSIISQWEENIKKLTNLKYFIIDNVFSLKKFEKLIALPNLNIDLVLIKVGRVTNNFKAINKLNTESKHGSNQSLFGAFNSILNGAKVARFIIDDFDVLKLSYDDYLISASFTWLISATRRQTNIKNSIQSGNTIQDFLKKNLSCPILNYAHDDILNKTLSIHCDPSYVDTYIKSTKVLFRNILVKGGNISKILQNLEVAPEILEMINGDAIATAAQTLGLEVTSIADLIKRVMGKHLDKLQNAMRTLNRIDIINNTTNDTNTINDINDIDSKQIRELIKNGTDEEFNSYSFISNSDVDFKIFLKNLKESAEEQKEKSKTPLNRMRDNIREGYCQCCSLPFKDEQDEKEELDEQDTLEEQDEKNEKDELEEQDEKDELNELEEKDEKYEKEKKEDELTAAYILANCCQTIVCESCITKTVNGKKNFIKRCPNCAQDICFGTQGLIRIGNEINLEDALCDIPIDDTEPIKIESSPIPKLNALLDIINESPVNCISSEYVAPYIHGMLLGSQDIPHTGIKKYLIFSMMLETTTLLSNEMTKFKINHQILHGTRTQKDLIIQKFSQNNNILLVTSSKDCAGLHLPFVSHIIFYHKVIDKNIEAQVAARGQRLGRTSNLEIISLLNNSEIK